MDVKDHFKRCICCKELQSPSAFLISRRYPDKLTPRCRKCAFTIALRIRAERDARAASCALGER